MAERCTEPIKLTQLRRPACMIPGAAWSWEFAKVASQPVDALLTTGTEDSPARPKMLIDALREMCPAVFAEPPASRCETKSNWMTRSIFQACYV
eukprot:scaffold196519_cov41-Prasinocladus_malaysianus.AAC.1